MTAEEEALAECVSGVRDRVVLEVVSDADATGFVIPPNREGGPYRGRGDTDFVCGGCRKLVAAGIRPGMFRNFVFACGCCGNLNRVPSV